MTGRELQDLRNLGHDDAADEIEQLRSALGELLYLEKLKKRASMAWWDGKGFETLHEYKEALTLRNRLLARHAVREPIAWEAARDALVTPNV